MKLECKSFSKQVLVAICTKNAMIWCTGKMLILIAVTENRDKQFSLFDNRRYLITESFFYLYIIYMYFSKKLFKGPCCNCVHIDIPLRWTHLPFNFFAFLALFLVLCPRTGKLMACLLPIKLLILRWCITCSLTCLFKSVSIVILAKVFVNSLTWISLNSITFNVGGIDNFWHNLLAVGSPIP